MTDIVNEKTTSYITASFYDKARALAAPSSATYKIVDVATGNEIKPDTSLTPAAEIEITIPPIENAIVNSNLATERHALIVTGTYGASDEVTGRYEFFVRNLNNYA